MKIAAIIPFNKLRMNMAELNRLFCCPEMYSFGLVRLLLAVTSCNREREREEERERSRKKGSKNTAMVHTDRSSVSIIANLVKDSKHYDR